jgi:hypothetical protein
MGTANRGRAPLGREDAQGELAMTQYNGLMPEERARITEIQDLLIERYVEQREAIENGDRVRAKEIESQIKELRQAKEDIQCWATVSSPEV